MLIFLIIFSLVMSCASMSSCRLRYTERVERRQYSVLAYGDSLTAGYHDDGDSFSPYAESLNNEEPKILCDHLGHSGWTAQGMCMAATFPQTLREAANAGFPYDLAVVMAGTNDLSSLDSERIAQDVWNLHERAHALGVDTMAIGVPQSYAQLVVDDLARCAQDVNRRLESLCLENDAATYVACPVLYGATTLERQLWEPDGLHMSAAGYDALGKALAPVVLDSLQRRS